MAVNELIFTQLTFALHFAMNSYTEFHENLTNNLIADNRLHTDVSTCFFIISWSALHHDFSIKETEIQ
jgi:hypothetical protein